MGLVTIWDVFKRARTLLHDNKGLFSNQRNNKYDYWKGSNTWLHIFFHKSLFIFGLGLEQNEVFLRWLLIERFKYINLFKKKFKEFKEWGEPKPTGWYIHANEGNDKITEGKKFFLKTIGFDVIEVESYKDIYENIWE